MKKIWLMLIVLGTSISGDFVYADDASCANVNDIAMKEFGKIFIKDRVSSDDLTQEFEKFTKNYENTDFKAMTDDEIKALKQKYGTDLIARNKKPGELRKQLALVQSILNKNQIQKTSEQKLPSESREEIVLLNAIPEVKARPKVTAMPEITERPEETALVKSEALENKINDVLSGQKTAEVLDGICQKKLENRNLKDALIEDLKNKIFSIAKRGQVCAQEALKKMALKAKNYAVQTLNDQKTRINKALKAFWNIYRNSL